MDRRAEACRIGSCTTLVTNTASNAAPTVLIASGEVGRQALVALRGARGVTTR